ncbi:hypothetical protein EAE89_08760 [Photorhabdus heterorhabditis]|nr:hypothetical protein [Photorhabdus heterorhabditis]
MLLTAHYHHLYPLSFKLPLCWLLSPPVTSLSIPFIFQAAALLAVFTYPSHRVIYAPGDAFSCRRPAT